MFMRVFSPMPGSYRVGAPTIANGRTYVPSAGTVIDVPTYDGNALGSNGWTVYGYSGPTAERPKAPAVAMDLEGVRVFYDTTLNKTIMWDGASWRDPLNGASV